MNPFFKNHKQQIDCSEKRLEDLVDYHTRIPGMTEGTYGSLRTINGQSSYEVLAQVLDDASKSAVLDLACGNGPLIKVILDQYPEVKKIVGIDLCQNDLDLAKKRFNSNRVVFKCESVQNLSIEDASIDCVLCHLAFFLFDPIEKTIDEINRVLRSSGKFACIISALDDSQDDYNQIVSILQEEVAKENPALEQFGWGDPRTHSKKGLKSLFDQRFDQEIEISNYNLVISEKPAELARKLMTYFYASSLLNAEGKKNVLIKWTEHFEKMSDASEFQLKFPLSRFVVTKR